jgi:hypothetical protein
VFIKSKQYKASKYYHMNKINQIIERLEKVKRTGQGKWLACCPAHPDKSPSLTITQTDDGKILIHCFSGCQVSDVVAAVGLELSNLFPENPSYKKGTKPPKFNKYELFDLLINNSYILVLAIRQLSNGEPLNQQDQLIVIKAENTINDIAMECRK